MLENFTSYRFRASLSENVVHTLIFLIKFFISVGMNPLKREECRLLGCGAV
jgi:hypothetical protein